MASSALLGSYNGPRSPGTAANLLIHHCSAGREVDGGPEAVIDALSAVCREGGVELKTSSEVRSIDVDGSGVNGVTLVSGEKFDAPVVVSGCHPKRTLLQLLPRGILPLGLEEETVSFRSRGITAKMHIALSGRPRTYF